MTAKRFEFQNQDYHLNMVYDNEKEGVIFNEDIVDCLNALHEENEKLKKLNIPIDDVKEFVQDCKGRIIGVYYND